MSKPYIFKLGQLHVSKKTNKKKKSTLSYTFSSIDAPV